MHCIAESHEPPQKQDIWALERRLTMMQADVTELRAELTGKLDALLARMPPPPAAAAADTAPDARAAAAPGGDDTWF